jgi:hypothetical protein
MRLALRFIWRPRIVKAVSPSFHTVCMNIAPCARQKNARQAPRRRRSDPDAAAVAALNETLLDHLYQSHQVAILMRSVKGGPNRSRSPRVCRPYCEMTLRSQFIASKHGRFDPLARYPNFHATILRPTRVIVVAGHRRHIRKWQRVSRRQRDADR